MYTVYGSVYIKAYSLAVEEIKFFHPALFQTVVDPGEDCIRYFTVGIPRSFNNAGEPVETVGNKQNRNTRVFLPDAVYRL
jgi:hypothetical protein